MKKLIITAIVGLSLVAIGTLLRYHMFESVMMRMALCGIAGAAWMTVVYLVARRRRRHDLVDAAWGMTFIIIALVGFLLQDGVRSKIDVQTFTTFLVIIWGLRLSLHIARRISSSPYEDKRYTDLTKSWLRFRAVRVYGQIFVLQALLALIIAIPVVHINLSTDAQWSWWVVCGGVLTFFGIVYETIADNQLRNFIAQPANKGKLMTSGLRHYTRYPNYFGELCVWWGFALSSLGTRHGWVGLIGALTITYLLCYVSGIPLGEKSGAKKSGWNEYVEQTSLLLPLPKKPTTSQ